ncbi:hypothetical protein [Nitrososphaera sp.]|uniref:hypothetical protein n=1 Tax=Nitrososphaera sp. TaxID=1971748 RepID=UPI002ED84C06
MGLRGNTANQPGTNRDYRKAFGQFSSNKTQRLDSLTAHEIELDSQEDLAGGVHTIDFEKGDIVIKQSGIYLIIACPQIGKVRGTIPRWIDFWVRLNNVDVQNSNIRAVVMDPQEKTVVPLNSVLPLNRGDTLNIMMAVESMGEGLGIEAIEPDGEPTIPSIIVTLVQLD